MSIAGLAGMMQASEYHYSLVQRQFSVEATFGLRRPRVNKRNVLVPENNEI